MINILHISDIHALTKDELQLKIRADKLMDDIQSQEIDFDILIVSGDIAFSGKPEEYELASKLFLDPIRKRLNIPTRRTFIAPGNHDVDRSLINEIENAGLQSICRDSDKANREIAKLAKGSSRQIGFNNFLKAKYDIDHCLTHNKILDIKGIPIGISVLNSAWLCTDDQDKGKLYITEEQVNRSADAIDAAHIKIAVIHHPQTWLNESDTKAIHDLNRRYGIIIQGHIHETISAATQTPSSDIISYVAKAIFDGRDTNEGYNYYQINPEKNTITANYRKFFRLRGAYDKDTGHAQDGKMESELPKSKISKIKDLILTHRCSLSAGKLAEDVRNELRIFQQLDIPIYVKPKIIEGSKSPGKSKPHALSVDEKSMGRGNFILTGQSEIGKSIFLKQFTAEYNQSNTENSFALYLDLKSIPLAVDEKWLNQHIDQRLQDEIQTTVENVLIVCDHIEKGSPHLPSFLVKIANDRKWKLILAIGNKFLATTLLASAEFSGFSAFQLTEWGPSRIREFLKELFKGKNVNIDAAYEFVTKSLQDTDLPCSPSVVTLYATIFPKLGNAITSLSFVRLLELVELKKLELSDNDALYNFYNKREALILLAQLIWENQTAPIPVSDYITQLAAFFSKKHLDIDAGKMIEKIIQSRLIELIDTETGTPNVAFSLYVFFDFYLAKALEKKPEILEINTSSIRSCIRISESLALYGGFVRDNEGLIRKILKQLLELFGEIPEADLSALDAEIKSRLLPKRTGESPEKVAEEHLKEQIDYSEIDPDFDEERENYKKRRKSLSALLASTNTDIDILNEKIEALRTFYAIFRNLEHLDGDLKVDILDTITKLHIRCNFDLINFYGKLIPDQKFKSLTAYIVTLGGQSFFTSYIGNQSLSLSILKAIENTKNDFKKLLLVCLYADLGLHDCIAKLEEFLHSTQSPSAIEIIYLKVSNMLITSEQIELPINLLSLFRKAFQKRNMTFGEKDALHGFTDVLGQIKAGRSILLKEKFKARGTTYSPKYPRG